MLTYNMDVEERSTWLRATPGAAALAQPFYCTEAGNFYGRAHFATARTDKESYLLFYTLSGSGLIEQNDQRVELPAGSALLLNCRTPQSYCTAPGQDHWHHYWAHLDGAGVANLAEVLQPQGRLSPLRSVGWKCSRCLSHWPPSGSTAPPHRSRSAWPCTGCWP
ncbi:AraC family ligand binding domain-containing protein [Gemmiger formicilis]|uniref:AraC family ligand binding domain-containing protein n=1 Tax=Gemmiger formicilis TaxID=745368 RepID=UPI0039944402